LNQDERQCSNCGRIYSQTDWQEENCPFCDLPLDVLDTSHALVSDTVSLQLPWPQGESEVLVGRAEGYLKAQLLKAALESEGISVLLQGGTMAQTFGLSVGSVGAVSIFVPESQVEQAKTILEIGEE